MKANGYNTGWRTWLRTLSLALLVTGTGMQVCGQQTTPVPPAGTAVPALPPPSAATGLADGPGVELDRVVAIVNGDLILESDIEEERRLAAFQPFRDPGGEFSRTRAIDRLINRALILQQAKLEQEDTVTDAEVQAQLVTLRHDIPACKRYECQTDAGWQKFVSDHGFTVEELTNRWRQRMEVLRFIEMRFRMGIHISDTEIKDYYTKTMLPEYAKEKVAAPKLEAVSTRIQEVLLQQQVGNLLEDWLKSLRAQGSVRILQPDEVAQ